MAEEKKLPEEQNEKEYIIPLRREWLRVSYYKRSRKAVTAIKKFIARHMKVPERDLSRVKLDVYLNNQIWTRGECKPPAKIKVKARREGDIIKIELAEVPAKIKFAKIRAEKFHKKSEEKKSKPEEKPSEEKPAEKTEEEKKEEAEKGKAVEKQNIKLAEAQAKAQKHITKSKAPQIQRKALKK